MLLQINKGRIFKKFHPSNDCKSSEETNTDDNRSHYSILEEYEIKECRNNNIIVNGLGENIILQETIKDLEENAVVVEEVYEIEKTTNESLKLLLACYMNQVNKII